MFRKKFPCKNVNKPRKVTRFAAKYAKISIINCDDAFRKKHLRVEIVFDLNCTSGWKIKLRMRWVENVAREKTVKKLGWKA